VFEQSAPLYYLNTKHKQAKEVFLQYTRVLQLDYSQLSLFCVVHFMNNLTTFYWCQYQWVELNVAGVTSSPTLAYLFSCTLKIISSIKPVNKYERLSETRLIAVTFSKLYLPISCILNAFSLQFGELELFDDSHARVSYQLTNLRHKFLFCNKFIIFL
jgi:hypothetical protein